MLFGLRQLRRARRRHDNFRILDGAERLRPWTVLTLILFFLPVAAPIRVVAAPAALIHILSLLKAKVLVAVRTCRDLRVGADLARRVA